MMNTDQVRRLAELCGRLREVSRRLEQDAAKVSALQLEMAAALETVSDYRPPVAAPTSPPARRLLDVKEVAQLVGLGKSTIWLWVQQHRFPEPRRLGGRCVRWCSEEVDAWIREQLR